MISHCIPEDDLIFYALGELDGRDRQRVDSHLLICPECLERVRQYQVVQHDLTRSGKLSSSDSRHNAHDRPRSTDENTSHPRMFRAFWSKLSARGSIIAMVLLLTVAVAMVSIDDVAGQFPFARQIGLAPDTVSQSINDFIAPGNELPGIGIRDSLNTRDTGKETPTNRQIPEELPLGLYLDDSYVLDDGTVGFYYLSRDYGLEVVILLEHAATSRTRVPEARAVLSTLGDIEILIDQNSLSSANGVLWLEGELLFSVSIARIVGALTITPEQLLEVVDAVIQNRSG